MAVKTKAKKVIKKVAGKLAKASALHKKQSKQLKAIKLKVVVAQLTQQVTIHSPVCVRDYLIALRRVVKVDHPDNGLEEKPRC